MTSILDCLVSYFGLDEAGQPTYRRYFCYHVVAGPGPTAGSGVASITTLAIYNDAERCTSCQNFHVVDTGGPAAALAKALQYLESYHDQDRLRKVQSDIRGLADGESFAVRHVLGVGSDRNHSGDVNRVGARIPDAGGARLEA
jgi:hypothetical protein